MSHQNHPQTQEYTRIEEDFPSTPPSVSPRFAQLRNVASPDLASARPLTTRAQILDSLMPLGRNPSSSISTLINNPQAPSQSQVQQLPSSTSTTSSHRALTGLQEDLYEAGERILMELRNHTEHSLPFLNKVDEREAPDYFQVIKHPMDLGTVLKKLKALAYQSKTQFANDLYLIYSNCLTYNSDPSSVYRKHAIAMRKRTQQLLETVPDVTMRDRAEVEVAQKESDEKTTTSLQMCSSSSMSLTRQK
ncbi:hypothetical protein BGZ68_005639 [Mortierella alpina]|nr:hypothetical protein BGZ68_005639 [Mortierella alpina]